MENPTPETDDDNQVTTGLNGWQIMIIVMGIALAIALAITIAGFFFPIPASNDNTISTNSTSTNSSPSSPTNPGNYIIQSNTVVSATFINSTNSAYSFTSNIQFIQSGNLVTATFEATPAISVPSGTGYMTTAVNTVPRALCPKFNTVFCIVTQDGGDDNTLANLLITTTGSLSFGPYISNPLDSPSYILTLSPGGIAPGGVGITRTTPIQYSIQ